MTRRRAVGFAAAFLLAWASFGVALLAVGRSSDRPLALAIMTVLLAPLLYASVSLVRSGAVFDVLVSALERPLRDVPIPAGQVRPYLSVFFSAVLQDEAGVRLVLREGWTERSRSGLRLVRISAWKSGVCVASRSVIAPLGRGTAMPADLVVLDEWKNVRSRFHHEVVVVDRSARAITTAVTDFPVVQLARLDIEERYVAVLRWTDERGSRDYKDCVATLHPTEDEARAQAKLELGVPEAGRQAAHAVTEDERGE